MSILRYALQPETVKWPARSAVVSYDNMSRLASPPAITFQGGPNLTGRYAGRWWAVLGDYAPGRHEVTSLLWSYSMPNGVTAQTGTRAAELGGTVNGYVLPSGGVPSPQFGGLSLYGARVPATGNTFFDPSSPAEHLRLLGDDPNESAYSDHQRGIESWTRFNVRYNSIHMDDPIGISGSSAIGAQFSESMAQGFSLHGPGSYVAYIRSRYASDAAYMADRSNPLNYYDDYRDHMLRKARDFYVQHWVPRAKQLGLTTSGNVFWPWPSESASTGHLVSDQFDAAIFEHPWFFAFWDLNNANFRAHRQAAENVSDATTLVNAFASLTVQFAYFAGIRKRAAVAIYPLSDWWPQPSAGNGSAPSRAPYTEPYKVRGLMRAMMAWAWAWGVIPVVPAGIYDGIFDIAPGAELAGYTGDNKPLWYGDPQHYADLFAFAAGHPFLFDEFESAPTVSLVAPCYRSTTAMRQGSGDNFTDTQHWVTTWIRPLIAARVPFDLCPVGGPIRQIPLSNYDLSRRNAVVKMAPDGTFTAVSAQIPTGSNVQATAGFFAGDLSAHAPVTVAGESDATRPVLANLRTHLDGTALALHLVNTNATDYSANAGAGAARARQTTVVATVKTAFLPRRPKSVLWFEPGQSGGRPVRWEIASDGLRISVPPLAEWGVCLIQV